MKIGSLNDKHVISVIDLRGWKSKIRGQMVLGSRKKGRLGRVLVLSQTALMEEPVLVVSVNKVYSVSDYP